MNLGNKDITRKTYNIKKNYEYGLRPCLYSLQTIGIRTSATLTTKHVCLAVM